MIPRKFTLLLLFFSIVAALSVVLMPKKQRVLPILGERDVVNGDTIYRTIPNFSFIDQDSQIVNNATFEGKIYVADFFFINCPTICPKVKANGLRIYNKYKNDPRLLLLSHTVAPKYDTVAALKRHAQKLGIETAKWHLVTGKKDEIYGIADDYFSIAIENPNAPGGYDHSGRIILVDTKRQVRSFCDGTDSKDVDRFMEDIDWLLSQLPPGSKHLK
jgi:protein SCO1/2